jgi:hypothetical protein
MEINNTLQFEKIEKTIKRLSIRIKERFPNSGLGKTCDDFSTFTSESKKHINWISKPIFLIRAITYVVIGVISFSLIYGLTLTNLKIKNSFTDWITVAESSLNNIVLLSAAFFFIFTLENRIKRVRAIKYLNEIKGFAHVVDMYQLTKNPQLIGREKKNTEHSPKREMTKFEMQRYLDYSSEFLSLIGKVAALYSQYLPDEVVTQTSSEIQNLCSDTSNKIWQKMIILSMRNGMDKK